MEKEDCKDCICLYECIGILFCDAVGLKIDNLYECPNGGQCEQD